MPQIGWFEILIIVVLAVLILGPKEFPIVIRKVGNWIGSAKRYFNEIQKDVSEVERSVEKEFSMEEKKLNNNRKENNKDE